MTSEWVFTLHNYSCCLWTLHEVMVFACLGLWLELGQKVTNSSQLTIGIIDIN